MEQKDIYKIKRRHIQTVIAYTYKYTEGSGKEIT
jgi:hypothetical protein